MPGSSIRSSASNTWRRRPRNGSASRRPCSPATPAGSYLGAKLFYRRQLPSLWSALSLNLAATNSAPFNEVLLASEASLTGRPVWTGRLGYELNLPGFQAKLGLSALRGPRNDQGDPEARQRAVAADLRLHFLGWSLSGELLDLEQDPGPRRRQADRRRPPVHRLPFEAEGFWAQLAYALPFPGDLVRRVTGHAPPRAASGPVPRLLSARGAPADPGAAPGSRRLGGPEGRGPAQPRAAGAPDVDNDVRTVSLIWTF